MSPRCRHDLSDESLKREGLALGQQTALLSLYPGLILADAAPNGRTQPPKPQPLVREGKIRRMHDLLIA